MSRHPEQNSSIKHLKKQTCKKRERKTKERRSMKSFQTTSFVRALMAQNV